MLNVSDNSLGETGSEAIAEALRENKVMKNLNMSKNNGGAKCAKIMADGVITNGALTDLNVSNNSIGQMVLPEGWTFNPSVPAYRQYTHTDGRQQEVPPEGSKPEGVIALADAIKNNGALSSLNLSQNAIPAETMGPIEALCHSRQIVLHK